MKLSPAQVGFVRGIGIVVLFGVLDYLANVAHLQGLVSPAIASIIAALAASYEAHLKSESGNTTALFGSVRVKK